MVISKVNMENYLAQPNRYALRSGKSEGAPLCPYGNHFEWVGYDKHNEKYVRFTKSVYKKLVQQINE